MRILALSDVHGSYDRVEKILSAETPFDAIVLAGDLTTRGTVAESISAIKRFQRFGKPLFAVAGNMDMPALEDAFDSLGVNINANGAIVDQAGFFGVAGSPFTTMHTPYEVPEDEILSRAEAGWHVVQSAHWKVFVPHSPPRGTTLDKILLGRHVGSTAVREFVEQHQPDVLICGHIHEARGTDILGRTTMVNCGAAERGFYAIIEIGARISADLRG